MSPTTNTSVVVAAPTYGQNSRLENITIRLVPAGDHWERHRAFHSDKGQAAAVRWLHRCVSLRLPAPAAGQNRVQVRAA